MSVKPRKDRCHIREQLAALPDVSATVIADRVDRKRSISVLRAWVSKVRPLLVPTESVIADDLCPGELAQCDPLFLPVDISVCLGPVGRPPVLMILSTSNYLVMSVNGTRSGPSAVAWRRIRSSWVSVSGW